MNRGQGGFYHDSLSSGTLLLGVMLASYVAEAGSPQVRRAWPCSSLRGRISNFSVALPFNKNSSMSPV